MTATDELSSHNNPGVSDVTDGRGEGQRCLMPRSSPAVLTHGTTLQTASECVWQVRARDDLEDPSSLTSRPCEGRATMMGKGFCDGYKGACW